VKRCPPKARVPCTRNGLWLWAAFAHLHLQRRRKCASMLTPRIGLEMDSGSLCRNPRRRGTSGFYLEDRLLRIVELSLRASGTVRPLCRTVVRHEQRGIFVPGGVLRDMPTTISLSQRFACPIRGGWMAGGRRWRLVPSLRVDLVPICRVHMCFAVVHESVPQARGMADAVSTRRRAQIGQRE
jgi:hypothetical protein